MTQAPECSCFPARLGALPQVLGYVRKMCDSSNMSPVAILRIELVIEELFTNSVRHGYGADSDALVWLQMIIAPGSLYLVYQDAAPAYDPLQHAAQLSVPVGNRPVGGLGIHLVRELATDIAYRRTEGRNILTLTFRT